MSAALKAGAAYFGIVFALGFVLGAVRVLILAPSIGPTAALVLELPIVLSASWIACGLLLDVFVADKWHQATVMGAFAFTLLIAAELCLSTFVFGLSAAEQLQSYRSGAGLLGLAGQIAFGTFPLLQQARRSNWTASGGDARQNDGRLT